MNNDVIKKWEALFATLIVEERSSLICSEAEIEQVEKELGFKFPAGYKEYSRVFGSGSLGQGDAPAFFRVYCPCNSSPSPDIRQTGHCLIGLKLDVDACGFTEEEEEEEGQVLYRLLEHGYAFADTDRADRFFWDLTTWREDDQSYDIYWIPDEEAEAFQLIGRDFFEFIDGFCLGEYEKVMFPDEDISNPPQTQKKFFSAFNPRPEIRAESSFTDSMSEDIWSSLKRNRLLTEKYVITLDYSYRADGKEQAECLQRAWSGEKGAEVEILSPTRRPNIPRLVTIQIAIGGKEISRELIDRLSEKAISAGKECKCPLSSFGSRSDLNTRQLGDQTNDCD